MKKNKISLGLTLMLLTLVSMAITNFVQLLFWGGDLLKRESLYAKRVMQVAARDHAPDGIDQIPLPVQAMLSEVPGACISWNGIKFSGDTSRSACQMGIDSFLKTTSGENSVSSSFSSRSDLLTLRYFYVATPGGSSTQKDAVNVIGIPVTFFLSALLEKERVIVLYLLFNALILAALFYLRMLKRFILPLESIVESAEGYRGDGFHVFFKDNNVDNELGQLAGSIQNMVGRIEGDKEKLRRAVLDLKNTNRLLKNNQKEMVRAEKMAAVGRLAAGLAHEIGNPLGVVQGYVQLLAMGDCQEQERLQYAENALEELGRVDRLMRQLLDHARTGTGVPTEFDVHPLITEITQSLSVQPSINNIHLLLDLNASNSLLCLDSEKLRQVLLNCLLNAVDAVQSRWGKGKEGGEIHVGTTTKVMDLPDGEDTQCMISIRDNGCGIPAEILESVFEPFFTTKEPGAGTGLGLSVSMALVESMQGRIVLSSVEGEGTSLCIILPSV